jgi:hypothetical protein
LKTKKVSLNVKHKKLQKDYKNMEQTFLKQQKELKELKVNIGMSSKGNLTKGRQKWTSIFKCKWLLMKSCRNFSRRPRGSNL